MGLPAHLWDADGEFDGSVHDQRRQRLFHPDLVVHFRLASTLPRRMRNSGAAAVADSFAGGSWPPRSPRRTRKRVAAVVGRLLEKMGRENGNGIVGLDIDLATYVG